ncbi:phage terminase small subunit P27 family [Bacillus cereus]|uniref:phage terminase small subunit P27 family n=1 Tax=Bacillus cereus TaxID=1396 RepID=UPI001145F80D|nr:phage terminase small subunit P27 family [Bacillus cereus]
MARRGRKKRPAEFKQGKSETQAELKDRAIEEKKMMGATDKVQTPPEYLNPLAKRYYEFIVTELEVKKMLDNLDVLTLVELCEVLSALRDLQMDIDENKYKYETFDRSGNVIWKENPSVKQKLNYTTQFRALCSELGISPAARAQLAGAKIEAKEQEADPLLKLLSRKKATQ